MSGDIATFPPEILDIQFGEFRYHRTDYRRTRQQCIAVGREARARGKMIGMHVPIDPVCPFCCGCTLPDPISSLLIKKERVHYADLRRFDVCNPWT